jgi:hypothetical protein
VKKYLDAWERAAADGHVPSGALLAPGADVDLSHLDADTWFRYYEAPPVREKKVDWAQEALRAVEGRQHAGRWAPLGARGVFYTYLNEMGRFPPLVPEGCLGRKRARKCAEVLLEAFARIPPSELSGRRTVVSRLRKLADAIEAAEAERR